MSHIGKAAMCMQAVALTVVRLLAPAFLILGQRLAKVTVMWHGSIAKLYTNHGHCKYKNTGQATQRLHTSENITASSS